MNQVMVPQGRLEFAGLETLVVEAEQPLADIVLLHGYAMEPEDLAPFARSLGVAARFLFPRGALGAHAIDGSGPQGRCWWPIDVEKRARALKSGPRDLSNDQPDGRRAASAQLHAFVEAIRVPSRPLVLGGFSQGGMLACESIFLDAVRPDALVLLSSSRVAFKEWAPNLGRAQGMPVFVAHGRSDTDLAFSAGEALFASLEQVTSHAVWCAFDGGHEIPLPVWRALRKFLREILEPLPA
jgi:phospholipase/carboxylesterase